MLLLTTGWIAGNLMIPASPLPGSARSSAAGSTGQFLLVAAPAMLN